MVQSIRSAEAPQEYARRFVVFSVLLVVPFALLIGRLYFLQVVRGEHYASRSEANFVQFREIPAIRGMIFDRHGEVLASNRPAYNVYLTPAFCTDRDATLTRLDEYLEMTSDELERVRERLKQARGLNRFRPQLVKADVAREMVSRLEFYRSELTGVDVIPVPERYYNHGSLAAHTVGYLNEIGDKELKELKAKGRDYGPGDLIGRAGIEAAFENELAGEDGERKVVVDVLGRALNEELARELIPDPVIRPSRSGDDLYSTIDVKLQQAAEEAFAEHRAGALVALDPRTGFVRAIVSQPGYDPNQMMRRMTVGEYRALVDDPLKPLLPRAIASTYPPGSTWKVVGAIAAMAEKMVGAETRLNCAGAHAVGGYRFRCHSERGHGEVNIVQALQYSCDVYFYKLAERMGIDTIAKYARMLGMGQSLGLALPGERVGIVPTRERHDKVTPGGYRLGFALNSIIGQGDTTATAMELAVLYAAVVNRGRVPRPQFVQKIAAVDGTVVRQFEPEFVADAAGVPGEAWDAVAKGLDYVVNVPGGTAFAKRIPEVRVMGKTGTAQVASLGKKRKTKEETPWRLRDHALFVAAAPVENPEIVVAVIHEHGGHGGSDAAPIAMQFLRRYFGLDEPEEEPVSVPGLLRWRGLGRAADAVADAAVEASDEAAAAGAAAEAGEGDVREDEVREGEVREGEVGGVEEIQPPPEE